MACIILRGPLGERRVLENHPYQLGTDEHIAGVDWTCAANPADNMEDLVTDAGFMVGNAIKKVTNALGMRQCMACRGRQQRFNQRGLELQQKMKEIFS